MDFFELLILLFILAPILEGIFGKKARDKRRQAPPRPPGGPGQQSGGQRQRQQAGGSASDMVPDDLWELLTGQKRPTATRPTPADEAESGFEAEARPLEEGGRPLESWDADLEPAMERKDYEPLDVRYDDGRLSTPPAPWETDREAAPLESTDLPEAYSLEQPIQPEPVRHAAFHARLEGLPPAARTRRRLHPDLKLQTAADLRRAVILKEVLGTPKGLE